MRQIFFDGSAIQPKLSGDLPDEKVHVVQPMGFKHSSLVSFAFAIWPFWYADSLVRSSESEIFSE